MYLHKAEFFQGMKRLMYPGHIERLWTSFDRDTTGTVSFIEFAPEAALDLARFKRWMDKQFNGARGLFVALDRDRSGQVSFNEFSKACPLLGLPDRLQESIATLFLLLDHEEGRGQQQISYDELCFLDKWKPPGYLWEEPDKAARIKFQEALVARHGGNPLLAWRRALDKDSSMRVSYEEFLVQCKYLTKHGCSEAQPACGPIALYVAIDEDRSGWFNLRDWDQEVFDLLRKFVLWARAEYGTTAKFLQKAEKFEADDDASDHGDGVPYSKFNNAVKPLGIAYAQRVMLFEGLQGVTKRHEGKAGRLRPQDVKFLAAWDPDWEVKEDDTWGKLAGKHVTTEAKKGIDDD